MGYGTRNNGNIRTFWPDDTETKLYFDSNTFHPMGLDELLIKVKEKFPEASMTQIRFEVEYIQTDCLGYDLYDPGDYTTFLKVIWVR